MPGFLPAVDQCCYCIELKIGVIIICIFCIVGTGGVIGLGSSGPCRGALPEGDSSAMYHVLYYTGYVQYACSVMVCVSSICILIYIIGVDALQIFCEIFAWAALIAGAIIIIISVMRTLVWLLDEIYREVCKPLLYAWPPIVIGAGWIYCACVVNSFGGS